MDLGTIRDGTIGLIQVPGAGRVLIADAPMSQTVHPTVFAASLVGVRIRDRDLIQKGNIRGALKL